MGSCRHCRARAQLRLPGPFLPANLSGRWLCGALFVLALALAASAIITITSAGSHVPSNRPTTTIVEGGPYRFTHNPIYLGMFLGLIGLAIASFDLLQSRCAAIPREHALPLLAEQQHLVFLGCAALHPGRAHRHARHGKSLGGRSLPDQALDGVCRDMPLDDVAVHLCRVAGAEPFGYAETAFDRGQIAALLNRDSKTGLMQMLDPARAAAAIGIFRYRDGGQRGLSQCAIGENEQRRWKQCLSTPGAG
jgi:Phospholipid methyltransferase